MLGSFQNLDLLTVGITVAATVVLGFSAYITDTKSITSRTFFQFSIVTALWGFANYISYQFSDPMLVIWLLRGVLFFAVLQAFFLYQLFLVFPDTSFVFSKTHRYVVLPAVTIAALAVLSPFGFEGFVGTVAARQVAIVTTGPGLGIFAIVAVGLVISALYHLIRKLHFARGRIHSALLILLGGVALMFLLIITFNLIVATVFTDPRFIPYGALFTFPFIAAAAYAILREQLFNIKVIGTSILVFLLSIASFAEIIFSNTLVLVLFRSSIFLLVLIFGVNLIQGVLREVQQREKIERLAADLEKANAQQVVLIHFITHQIKGFLTKSRNIFSMALEGDFGELPETFKPMAEEGLRSDTQGVTTVQEILNASNIKSGQVTYTKVPFDFGALVNEIVTGLKPNADAKQLALTVTTSDGPYIVNGDRMQLTNALKNIIDNAIKYTPSGSVNVSVQKDGDMIRFEEKDTGVGITPEDMAKLFTEGGHGKESLKVNVESTGFGLYIVKNIIDGHDGKIWAESEGAGKGSAFIIELPISKEPVSS